MYSYAKDDPFVQSLTKNGECFRCARPIVPGVGFPGNYTHRNDVWVFIGSIPHTCGKSEDGEEAKDEEVFDPKIWFQVSRKFRHVARLPEGMNGREALLWALQQKGEVAPHMLDWAQKLDIRSAAEQFLRCYANQRLELRSAGDQLIRVYGPTEFHRELTVQQFEAFRKAGGSTYR